MQLKTFIRFPCAVCLIGFFLLSCNPQEPTAGRTPPAIPVTVTVPSVKDITVYLESIGTLNPSVFLEVRPQTSGTLAQVFIREGQIVKRGDPLFKIDSAPYEIKVKEAEAQLAIDESNFKAVQKKIARYQGLADKDLVAQTEWDELKAQLKKAEAAIALNSARLDFAKLDLEHCRLDSPLDGRIGKLDAHPGFLVANGQTVPLATISKIDPLMVEFTVTEKEFPMLPKNEILFTVAPLCSQGSCEGYEGAATFIDNHFDQKTGLLLIRGAVENIDLSLRPGQSVRVRIPVALIPNALLVPQKSIRYNQTGPYVYIVDDAMTVGIKQLTLGKEQGSDQIVLEGLAPEERLVLEGHLRISPGVKVEIKS